MKYVTVADIHDEVLNCRSEDLEYANAFLSRLARNYGVDEQEAQIPPSAVIKRLGAAVACRECAAAMVGQDTTVMVNGIRTDDVYLQKYHLYRDVVNDLQKGLSYADFAKHGTLSAGKGGVGVISLSRS